ncbi:MAG: heavy metal translocating P-type ATPase, partial [Verrucomicrobiota bacterium]
MKEKNLNLKIAGLDCAQEVKALKKTVGRLDGVSHLDFNVIQGSMDVTYDEDRLSYKAILGGVKQAGLTIRDPDDPEHHHHHHHHHCHDHDHGWWSRHHQAGLCLFSGLFLLAGFVLHAVLHDDLLHALTGGSHVERHTLPPVVIGLYLAAMLAGGWKIFPKAWVALKSLRADMNLLMTIAVTGAVIIGEWIEATTVTFLFAFSLLLESWSVNRARRAIGALMDLSPDTARHIDPDTGEVVESRVDDMPLGATILVRPGERVPLDGSVTEGRTSINQAPITGESIPVSKEPGDEVFAGTINEDGSFKFTATKAASETTLSRITRLVEEAQSRHAPAERWVEKFAQIYTPIMMLLALGVAVLPPLLLGASWSAWIYQALVLLVIACPCALVISTPVTIVSALAASARAGVLIKGGAFLEAAAGIKVVALDKTGTITHGKPEVQNIVTFNEHTAEELLARAAAMEVHSEHPLARAVLQRAEADGIEIPESRDFRCLKGLGAEADVFGRR